jgi:hypothetical protein
MAWHDRKRSDYRCILRDEVPLSLRYYMIQNLIITIAEVLVITKITKMP